MGYAERLRAKPLYKIEDIPTLSANELDESFRNSISSAATVATVNALDQVWKENKRYMGGAQGHGYAAEYANNTIDRLLGKNVINEAQNLQNGHQVKDGADRIINGIEIQTKYCVTPEATLEQYLKGNYQCSDGFGRMTLECPREQYFQILKLCKERGLEDIPVRRGHITYEQGLAISKSGTIEGITIDAVAGIISTSNSAGISVVVTFAEAIWRGEELDVAAAMGVKNGINVLGKGTLIHVLTAQVTERNKNYVNHITESMSNTIKKSKFAQSQSGKNLGLDKMTSQKIFGTSISVAITFGPDVCKAAQGKISGKQLLKNSAVSGGSILAAKMIGEAIGEGLLGRIGAVAAGAAAGFVVKKLLDKYTEDDAVTMFKYLKEEFIDVVMQINLSGQEREEVIAKTIGHPQLHELLQQMYMSDEYRRFAREVIVESAVVEVLSKRENITENMMQNGVKKLIIRR